MYALFPRGALAAFVALAFLSGGCGGQGDGVDRYDISGTVTIGGEPVNSGQIVFQPESGAPGMATIAGGKYDTRKDGKGTIGGPHTVRIDGLNPSKSGDGGEVQISWQTEMDLPKQATTQNFEIPAEAAQPVPPSNQPPP